MRLARYTIIAGVLLAVSLPAGIAGETKPVWVCITRPIFVDAIQPLADKRTEEGFDVRIISTDKPAEELSKLTRQINYLLIVGDDQPGCEDQPWYVPAKRVPTYRWSLQQPAKFASDFAWADTGTDSKPDFPVGRIPARTAEQVRLVVQKILTYEALPPSQASLDLPVGAGAACYNPTLDKMTTGMLITAVRTFGPRWAQPWIVSGDITNSLCGWPPESPTVYWQRLANGPAIACLIGHGLEQGFLFTPFNGELVMFTADQASKVLAKGDPSGPMVIVACLTGKFTDPEPCMAEEMLFLPTGPVAMIGATRESHPIPNYFTGISLLMEASKGHQRLGDLWHATQQRMIHEKNVFVEAALFDAEGMIDGSLEHYELRRDQFLMYAIFGDPATRMKLPGKLHGQVTREAGAMNWQVDKPKGATSLIIDYRASGKKLPTVAANANADTRRRLQVEANHIFAFEPVGSLDSNQPWQGSWNRPGTLRLTAIGPEKLHVAVLELEAPAPKLQNSPAPTAARR